LELGDRDLVDELPSSIRRVLSVLFSFVAIDGAVFDLAALATCRNPDYEWLCLYVPEYSPLWRPFVELTDRR